MKKIFVLSSFISLFAAAQPPRPAPTPNDTLQSVRTLPNNGVTLSIYAPRASEVSVSGDFPGGFPSVKLSKADLLLIENLLGRTQKLPKCNEEHSRIKIFA